MAMPSGVRPLKERQREERERLILQAADELLLERGYHETSMDDIAARVGVSKGTLYLHFASKEDLVLALLEGHMRAFGAAQEAVLGADLPPGAKLRQLIEQVYGGMVGRSRLQIMAALGQSPELRSRLLERREKAHDNWAVFVRRLGAVIEEGQAAGELDAAIPPAVLVGLFTSLLNPHPFRQMELFTSEPVPHEALAGYVSRFFFKGAGAACSPPGHGGGRDGDEGRAGKAAPDALGAQEGRAG